MADNHFDTREHQRTYSGFVALSKWLIVLIVVILIGLAQFV